MTSPDPATTTGWHADPTGRFGQRYFDGARWTDHVVSARGETIADPLPPSDTPLAPPRPVVAQAPAPPPPGVPSPAQPHPSQPHPSQPYPSAPYPVTGPAGPGARYLPGLGLAVAAVGLIMLVLSLLVLPWSDADDSGFLDLGSAVRDAGPDAYDDVVLFGYVAGGAFALLLLTLVFVVVACVPLPRTGAGGWVVVVGAVVTGSGAVLHGYLLHTSNVGDFSLGVEAWLGLVGFVLAGVGIVLGARRAAPGR